MIDATVERAVAILRGGGLVAFPTETVYGLGADASNRDAMRALYARKGRPSSHPVIVHLAHAAQLGEWGSDVPPVARALTDAFWPGPLTVVVRRAPHVLDEVTGGLETVGLRVPAHPVALELLTAFAGGLAAPSANRFGQVSPTTADAVRAALGEEAPFIIDGGPCAVGVESTIVDCTSDPARVLRLGGVTGRDLRGVLGVELEVGGATRAPGTLASHYSPNARVDLVAGPDLAARCRASVDAGERVGTIAEREWCAQVPSGTVTLATPADAVEYAHDLYAALRQADVLGLDVVLAVPPASDGIGRAVADRLRRAATPH